MFSVANTAQSTSKQWVRSWCFSLPARLGALLLLALAQGACIMGYHPVNMFSEDVACPKKGLVFQRTDVRADDLSSTVTPPPDVASDPGRLAVWNKNASAGHHLAAYSELKAFEVTGCGTSRAYFCWKEDRGGVACEAVDLHNAGATFDGLRIKQSLWQRLAASPKESGASRYVGTD